jgi:hypothetical protein
MFLQARSEPVTSLPHDVYRQQISVDGQNRGLLHQLQQHSFIVPSVRIS